MKAIRIVSIFFCICLLTSTNCSDGNDQIYNKKILINLDQLSIADPQKIFSKIEFIPLETSERSQIVKINQLKYYQGQWYILDKAQSCIFVFDNKGKFIAKIYQQGEGPGKYRSIEYFDIHNNDIEILDPRGKLLIYDMNGEFQATINPDFQSVFRFTRLDDGLIVFYSFTDEVLLKYYSEDDGQLKSEHILNPAFRLRLMGNVLNPFFNLNKRNYFINGTTGNIYLLYKDNIEIINEIDFGKNHLRLDDYPLEVGEPPSYYLKYLLKNEIAHPILYFFPFEEILVVYYKERFQIIFLNKGDQDNSNPIKLNLPFYIKTFQPFIYSDPSSGIYGYTTDLLEAKSILQEFYPYNLVNLEISKSRYEQNPILIRFYN